VPTATRHLSGPPNTLGLSLRAALPLVPGASRLPFVAGGGRQVPDVKLELDGERLDHARLTAYERVCEFPQQRAETLPVTAPHLLAFPLHMALMTDGAFPFGAVGLVHLRNRIQAKRPIGVGEPLDIAVNATPISAHPRGLTFTIVTTAASRGEVVWEERSTMLHRDESRASSHRNGAGSGGGQRATAREPTETARWQLAEDLGRRYGSVSGDRNPIHMHALSARLFGFPRAIAHGMWTKARCLAELEPSLPDAYSVEVTFRKPILLPGEVAFATAVADGRTEFEVRSVKDREKVHLEGTVSW